MTAQNIEKTPLNDRLIKVFGKIDDFLYTSYYPIAIGLIAVISYILNVQLLGIALFILVGCYVLVSRRDCTPILPILSFFIFNIRDLDVTGSLAFYLILSPDLVCLIIHFIKFPLKTFNVGKLFLPLCAVSIALLLSGLLSPYASGWANGLLYTIPIGPVMLIIYLYFANYLAYPEKFDLKKYFSVILVVLGFIVAIEFSYNYYFSKVLADKTYNFAELGWGNVNSVGAMLLLAIPATCYLFSKKGNLPFYVGTVLFFYYTIYLTGSDGSLGISLAFLPFLAYFVYVKMQDKKSKKLFNILIFIVAVGAFLALLVLCFIDKFNVIIDFLTEKISGESGRSKLYRDAWRIFLENPLFGAGFGYYNHNVYFPPDPTRLFNFHSTLFQVIGGLGIVGFLAYVYLYYNRLSILMAKGTAFNLFVTASFLMFACYGFIDTLEFSATPGMIILILLFLVTEFTNVREGDRFKPLKEFNGITF